MALIDNLVAYYKCDGLSGTALVDSYASFDIPVLTGIPGSQAGIINTSRSYPSTGAYHQTSNTNFLTNHSPTSSQRSWAANFWVYPFSLSTDRGIISASGGSGSFGMLVRSEATSGGRFAFFNSTNGTTFDKAMALGSASINTWHMITIGWDKAAGDIWGYLNGTFAASVAMTAYHTVSGSFQVGSWAASPQHYDGRIDEFAWWRDRGRLTQDEVDILYNGGAGIPLSKFTGDSGDFFLVF